MRSQRPRIHKTVFLDGGGHDDTKYVSAHIRSRSSRWCQRVASTASAESSKWVRKQQISHVHIPAKFWIASISRRKTSISTASSRSPIRMRCRHRFLCTPSVCGDRIVGVCCLHAVTCEAWSKRFLVSRQRGNQGKGIAWRWPESGFRSLVSFGVGGEQRAGPISMIDQGM